MIHTFGNFQIHVNPTENNKISLSIRQMIMRDSPAYEHVCFSIGKEDCRSLVIGLERAMADLPKKVNHEKAKLIYGQITDIHQELIKVYHGESVPEKLIKDELDEVTDDLFCALQKLRKNYEL